MKINVRYNDMELRSCNKNLLSKGNHTTMEIIKWCDGDFHKDYCYTIAWFEINGSEASLKFVGERPIAKDVDWNLFKELVSVGYQLIELMIEQNEDRDGDEINYDEQIGVDQ